MNQEGALLEFLEDPEERAKWIFRLRIAYILWIIFLIVGLLSIALYYLLS